MMLVFMKLLCLTIVIVLLLTGCATAPVETTNTQALEQTKTTLPVWATRPQPTRPDQYSTEISIKVQYLPENVENPDNLPVLKYLCLTQYYDNIGYSRVWNEAAANELNQMLADRNMPFRVQFILYTSDYRYAPLEWFARSEIQDDLKMADLIYHNIPLEKVEEYLEPLGKYITGNEVPTLKNAVPHEKSWYLTTKNNEIYGISSYNQQPTGIGWRVDPEIFSRCGLTEQDFRKEFWEMDDVLAKIYKENGNTAFLYIPPNGIDGIQQLQVGHTVWSLYPSAAVNIMNAYFVEAGSVYALDFSKRIPAVINTLDTDIGRKIQIAIARYDKAGYLIRDNTEDRPLAIDSVYGHRPYNDYDGKRAIPVGKAVYDEARAYLYQCNGVLRSSNYKKEAVSLLSLIAEDEAFRNHLLFGKEGRDYTIDADGNYLLTKHEDGTTYYMAFLSPFGKFSDLTSNTGYEMTMIVGDRDDVIYEGMTELESYREMWDNVGEPYRSIAFDFTGLEKEVEEVRIWAKYHFSKFSTMTEEQYNQMITDINAAGGTKIMAELQKQLDEWVKANPDKVAANRS